MIDRPAPRLAAPGAIDRSPRAMVRILRNILLHLLSAGMLVAAIASQDAYWHNMLLLIAGGAFVLAWVPLGD